MVRLADDVADMQPELTGGALGEVLAQGFVNHGEGDLRPGDVFFGEQPHFQTFLAGTGFTILELAAKHQVHLTDVQQRIKTVQGRILGYGVGFFARLAHRRRDRRFAVLHKSGRQRPQAITRFDSPPAQQHPPLPFQNTAGDDLRVLVVNGIAHFADMPGQVVARRDAQGHARAALATKIHGNVL